MNRLSAIAIVVVAAAAAAAGLFASPSNSAKNPPTGGYCKAPFCNVALTGAGPSPSSVKMHAANYLSFDNTDSVTHTVVFANGLCTLTLTQGQQGGPGSVMNGVPHPKCNDNFPFDVGSYAYTVDGKFAGMVVTTPLRRVVTLTARSHSIRRGTRLRLHGQVIWSLQTSPLLGRQYLPVIVLARHNSQHPFEPVARFEGTFPGGWKLKVRPDVTTTYIAKVTAQLPHWHRHVPNWHGQGQVWTSAESRPFTVRVRP